MLYVLIYRNGELHYLEVDSEARLGEHQRDGWHVVGLWDECPTDEALAEAGKNFKAALDKVLKCPYDDASECPTCSQLGG
jgi:hypothetical protein